MHWGGTVGGVGHDTSGSNSGGWENGVGGVDDRWDAWGRVSNAARDDSIAAVQLTGADGDGGQGVSRGRRRRGSAGGHAGWGRGGHAAHWVDRSAGVGPDRGRGGSDHWVGGGAVQEVSLAVPRQSSTRLLCYSPDDGAAGRAVGDRGGARDDGELLSGVDSGLGGNDGQEGSGNSGETHLDGFVLDLVWGESG